MLDQNVAREVLQEAVRTGGDFAEIFMEDRIDHAMGMRSHKLESATTSRTHGAGVRVFSGTNAIYAYTNDTSREGLMNCARQAAAAVRGGKGCVVAPFKPWDASRPEEILLLPTDVKAALKAEKLRAAEAAARSVSPEIVQVMANYGDHVQDVCICNTEGVFVTDRRVQTRLRVSAIASNGTENQSGSDAPGASMGFELFDTRVNAEESGKIAAQQAVTMLHAPVCPAGVMPGAIDNGFGGVIFHEACGHSLEATSVGIGVSEFCGKLGQQIASPIVTAIDDGTLVNNWGQIHVDDEGTPSQRTVLIENGILKGYMQDKLNARLMGMTPTGNGRRESYAHLPMPRMTNTYMLPGKSTPQEIIESVEYGIYAPNFGGGQVDITSGKFVFSTSEAYLIENGKVTKPVKGATLIGSGIETMQQISMVGNDLKLDNGVGVCGKEGQSLPVGVGQPTLKVDNLTVGGTA